MFKQKGENRSYQKKHFDQEIRIMKRTLLLITLLFVFATQVWADCPWTVNGDDIYLATGRCGFGTPNPTAKLHTYLSGTHYILMDGADNVDATVGFQLRNNAGQSQASIHSYKGDLKFDVGALESPTRALTIDGGGNVGFGTSNPTAKLHIYQSGTHYILMDGADNADATVGFQLRNNAGQSQASIHSYKGDLKFDVGALESPTRALTIDGGGNVGIGTTAPGGYKLAVEGKIGAREVVVMLDDWSDDVFEADYHLLPLSEVERHIKENKHLPDIPSEKDVSENGVSIGEMQVKLLQKIEELTLYMIELKKENEQLKRQVSSLEEEINN